MLMNNRGFTLAEVILVVGIMAVAIVGMVRMYIFTTVHAEISGSKTVAMTEAQGMLEQMRMADFDTIVGTFDKQTSTLSLLNGYMFIDISDANPELLEVSIVVSWDDKYNRKIGEEDIDRDGVLDSGEDLNGDGEFSSPVVLQSMITRR